MVNLSTAPRLSDLPAIPLALSRTTSRGCMNEVNVAAQCGFMNGGAMPTLSYHYSTVGPLATKPPHTHQHCMHAAAEQCILHMLAELK